MLRQLADHETWIAFYEYKVNSGSMSKRDEEALRNFIEEKAYLPLAEHILSGGSFDPPRKSQISKAHTQKKRTVYIYDDGQKNLLKLLNYLLQRKYDHLFADNLYSFRAERNAKDAIRRILHRSNAGKKWVYKADISNYFNSIPVDRLLVILKETLKDEPQTYDFLASLLLNPNVQFKNELIQEEKGIMAGVPTASFLANLYLAELDWLFEKSCVTYARYSDDIIVFAEDEQTLLEYVRIIKEHLAKAGLCINPEKEQITPPGEMWTFLGVSCHNCTIDISPVSLGKIKAKIRRKTRALKRWQEKKGLEGIHAAKALVRVFNRKFYETDGHELIWSRWYFPVINTDISLKVIDQYLVDSIRYLVTDKRTKARYNCRYEDIKELGFRSLVNEYYKYKKAE